MANVLCPSLNGWFLQPWGFDCRAIPHRVKPGIYATIHGTDGVVFFARDRAARRMHLDRCHFFLWPEKVRLRVHLSCNSPNDHRLFPVLPEASQAARRVYWQWVILEFENVRNRRGSNQS